MYNDDGSHRIDIDAHLSSQPLNRNTVALSLLLAAVLIVDGFDIVLLAYLAPAISEHFGLSVVEFGFVLTLGHVGVALGGIAGGMAGDRLGRRPVLIASVTGFALGTLLCAIAPDATSFVLARIAAAVFMGAASPNIATYLVDVLPQRWNARLGFMAYTAYAVGSVLCGVTANTLLPTHGWQIVFLVGGATPLALLPIVIIVLPESPRFLVRRGKNPASIARAMNVLSASRSFSTELEITVLNKSAEAPNAAVNELWTNHRGTLVGYSLLAALLYFSAVGITSTGTLILTAAGLPPADAIAALLYHNFAGLVGALLAVFAVNRLGSRAIFLSLLSVSLICLTLLAGMFSARVPSPEVTIALFSVIGFGLSSSLMLLYPVAAQAFPPDVRGTGTGAVTSLGRIGAIVCSVTFGGALVGWGVSGVFAFASCVVGATMVVVLLIRRHITPRVASQAHSSAKSISTS